MVLNIPLDAAAEDRLRDRASRAGVDVAEFVRRLVDEAARDDAAVQFDATLDEVFAADQQALPATSCSYSRDQIYSDGE